MLRLRLFVSLVVLLSMLAPLVVPAASARQATNVSTPEAAAVFYSQMEAAGSFSALYQYLHPDAQQIVPEAAVVGWYVNEFAPNGPGVITVTGVEMTSWTWEVTGTTYPNTAVVSFQQPFSNGTVVTEVVRLVESNGEWRWFFGRSRAFVDEQIEKYGSTSAQQSQSAQTSDDLCASEVVPLIQQAGLDVTKSAPALHCRQDGAGQWFMPTVADIAGPSASADLDSRGQQILQAVDRMAMDNAFAPSLRFDRSRSITLVPGSGGVVDETDISQESLGPIPNWMHYVRDSYEQSMRTYLTRTAGDEAEILAYIEWYATRRNITLGTMFVGVNPMAADAYLDNWGYQRAPWPWQLADATAIADYLNQTSGNAQASDQPASTDTSDAQGSSLAIALEPSTIEARPGETVRLDITYTRLQGVTDVAFMASAEGAAIVNLPLADIDMTGAFACSSGHQSDAVKPSERARETLMLPSHLEVQIAEDAKPGDQLSVCFELVGFSGARELFSWNATATILVTE